MTHAPAAILRQSELERLQAENSRLKEELARSRRASAALQEEADYMRALLEATSDGIFLMHDTFLDCNQGACSIWKCDRNDILGGVAG